MAVAVPQTDTLPPTIPGDFDAAEFVRSAQPPISAISTQRVTLRCVIDTITDEKTDARSFFKALHPAKAGLIRRFSFDPGKGYRELSLWIVCATYPNAAELASAFNTLHKQSGPVRQGDNLPGLTYANDYVIIVGDKIYWLNTGCIYSYSNHQKIAQILRHTLNATTVKDSIACKCGLPKCE